MASAFAHAAAGAALWPLFRSTGAPRRMWLVGAALAVAPDLDVIGFRFGVAYGDLLGHRGLTHSLLVAAVIGSLVGWLVTRADPAGRWPIVVYCIVAMASHGLLDAMTTGGLGVALWSPVSAARYFFPFRPIAVSPLGIRPFFTRHGLAVLGNEAIWVGLPALAVAAIGMVGRRKRLVTIVAGVGLIACHRWHPTHASCVNPVPKEPTISRAHFITPSKPDELPRLIVDFQSADDSTGHLRRGILTLRPLFATSEAPRTTPEDSIPGHYSQRPATPGRYQVLARRVGYVAVYDTVVLVAGKTDSAVYRTYVGIRCAE